nr:hypothetical protein [Edaphobacter lichenicola]
MRFGTSHDGMLIGVQIVGSWQAESTILHVASPLEQVSLCGIYNRISNGTNERASDGEERTSRSSYVGLCLLMCDR